MPAGRGHGADARAESLIVVPSENRLARKQPPSKGV